jgi:anti-sigma factor RsiW
MALVPRRLTRASHEQDWLRESVDAELLEQNEELRATVARLEAQVHHLEAVLGAAGGDHLGTRLDDSPVSVAEAEALVPVRPRQDRELSPIVWSRLPLLATVFLGSWGLVGALVYLVLQLAS